MEQKAQVVLSLAPTKKVNRSAGKLCYNESTSSFSTETAEMGDITMGRKGAVPVLIAVTAGLVYIAALLWFREPTYWIEESVSSYEASPMSGVSFDLEANRSRGWVTIENQGAEHLTFCLRDQPIDIEKLEEDGWHRLCSTKPQPARVEAVSQGGSYQCEFSWKEWMGGNLSPGKYRAIFHHGTGSTEFYVYSMDAEFTIS